jgi:hypothetical protein
MPASRFILIALLGVAVCYDAWGQARRPAAPPLSPLATKARYLIYFGAYVTWPADAVPDPKRTFEIGILGVDPFGDHLKVFAGHQVAGRQIVIHQFDTMNQYVPCHLLFISGDDIAGQSEKAQKRLKDALAQLAKQPVLIVTETPGFANKDEAVINFVDNVLKKQIEMDISRGAAQRAALQIDPGIWDLPVVNPLP